MDTNICKLYLLKTFEMSFFFCEKLSQKHSDVMERDKRVKDEDKEAVIRERSADGAPQ